jgi:hypothetical protein
MIELRRKFIDDAFEAVPEPKVLVVAVRLPSGAIETITNYHDLPRKILYYTESYDDNFCLKANSGIQIIGYMMV